MQVRRLALLVAIFLAGCATPSAATLHPNGCADLVAQQLTHPKPVTGAYDCLDESGHHRFTAQSFADYVSQDPVVKSIRFLGRSDNGGYIYAATLGDATTSIIRIGLDDQGKIDSIRGFAG